MTALVSLGGNLHDTTYKKKHHYSH